MWGLLTNSTADPGTTWVPIAVLTASLLGSAHCLGMCGGLVTSVGRTRAQWTGYQAGRLLAYASLGALAGAVGQEFLGPDALRVAAWVAAVLMALGFFALGARAWQGGSPHFNLIPQAWLSWAYRRAHGVPWVLGVLSAALPCGWLHSFVLAAAATQSAAHGAILMTCFWLGTLPALSAAPWLVQRVLRRVHGHSPRVVAVVLFAAGLAGLGFKMSSLLAGDHASSCHQHAQMESTDEME